MNSHQSANNVILETKSNSQYAVSKSKHNIRRNVRSTKFVHGIRF